MKQFNFELFIAIILSLIFLSGCSTTKKTAAPDPSIAKLQEANTAFNSGDYQKSLTLYEELLEMQRVQKKTVDSIVFQNAGIAAWELKQPEKSLQYLEIAKRSTAATPQTYSILTKICLQIDNLSKEITNLEAYINKYPQGEEIGAMRKQLFMAYVRSENWELADKAWGVLDKTTQNEVPVLDGYLTVNRSLDKKDMVDKLAKQLLKVDKNNINALDIIAEKYYWLAENRYLKEMKAYQANRTEKQYQQLLEAFKGVNENFKISLDYYLRLYKLDPKTRYATFIGNIYNRFENKEKAEYYHNLAKKKQ